MKPKPLAWLKNLTVPVCGMGSSFDPIKSVSGRQTAREEICPLF
jgi:hypothetical protein